MHQRWPLPSQNTKFQRMIMSCWSLCLFVLLTFIYPAFLFFFSSQILFCWFTNPRFLLFLFFLLLFFLLLIWHLLFVRLYRQTYYCVNVKDSSTITPQPEEIHFITEVVYSVQRREGGYHQKEREWGRKNSTWSHDQGGIQWLVHR